MIIDIIVLIVSWAERPTVPNRNCLSGDIENIFVIHLNMSGRQTMSAIYQASMRCVSCVLLLFFVGTIGFRRGEISSYLFAVTRNMENASENSRLFIHLGLFDSGEMVEHSWTLESSVSGDRLQSIGHLLYQSYTTDDSKKNGILSTNSFMESTCPTLLPVNISKGQYG